MFNLDGNNKRQIGHELTPRRRRLGAFGFTLIELLVVAAIASFMGVGLWSMFKSNRLALALVDDVRNMEQNARVGMDFMSRDMRKAGMGGQGNQPFKPVDNLQTATATAMSWAMVNAGFTAKGRPVLPGTDVVEIFWGLLPQAICLSVNGGIPGFNANAANVKVPLPGLIGLPGYSPTLGSQAMSDLLSPLTVLIYDPNCPMTVNCTKNLTGGNTPGNNAQLDYNNGQGGVNTDDANRPHTCNGFTVDGPQQPAPACPSGGACINIGSDQYYFVQALASEPGNAQLVRYTAGVVNGYDVISNYVEDFQIMFGVDGLLATDNPDGMVGSNEWINGITYDLNQAGPRTYMVRVFLLTKSMKQDPQLMSSGMKQNPPHIDNSTIATPAGGGDYYRRRLLSRTIRMRVRV